MDLLGWLRQQEAILTRAMTGGLGARRQRLADLSRALPRPETLLDQARQRLDLAAAGLAPALRHRGSLARARLDRAAATLGPARERAVAKKRLQLGQTAARLSPAILSKQTRQARRDLAQLVQRLDPARDQRRLSEARRRLDGLAARLDRATEQTLAIRREQLGALDRLHRTLGYTETLKRGYAVVRAGKSVVTTETAARAQSALEIEFADGRLAVTPLGVAAKPASKPSPPKTGPDQGQLF